MTKPDLYQQLLLDIRQGVWPAQQPLTQQRLAAYYHTSRIPVRDALARLQAEGWLVAHGKASLMVPPFTAAEAAELCLLRTQLEPLALQYALPHLTHAILGAARDCLDAATLPDLDPLQIGQLNWQFHRTLYQACGMPTLLQILDFLHQKVEMYLGFQQQRLDYQMTSDAEHRQLLALLAEGQHSAALLLLQQHISVAGAQLVEYLGTEHE